MGKGSVAESELMPRLVDGYTEAICSKLKRGNSFLKPNFETLPGPLIEVVSPANFPHAMHKPQPIRTLETVSQMDARSLKFDFQVIRAVVSINLDVNFAYAVAGTNPEAVRKPVGHCDIGVRIAALNVVYGQA